MLIALENTIVRWPLVYVAAVSHIKCGRALWHDWHEWTLTKFTRIPAARPQPASTGLRVCRPLLSWVVEGSPSGGSCLGLMEFHN